MSLLATAARDRHNREKSRPGSRNNSLAHTARAQRGVGRQGTNNFERTPTTQVPHSGAPTNQYRRGNKKWRGALAAAPVTSFLHAKFFVTDVGAKSAIRHNRQRASTKCEESESQVPRGQFLITTASYIDLEGCKKEKKKKCSPCCLLFNTYPSGTWCFTQRGK